MTVKTRDDVFLTVEVYDPHRLRSVLLEGLRPSATMAEVRARAMSELKLPEDVRWNLRHEQTGRLTQEDQRLEGLLGEGLTQIELTLQPDAGLGGRA